MKPRITNTTGVNPKKLTKKQQEFVDDLKHSLMQVEQHINGEIKLQSADQLLDEL